MDKEIEIDVAVQNSLGSGKTFAEFIVSLYKDKYVEIYLGDSYEDITTEQVSTSYPAVLCGKVLNAYKECLVLNGVYVNKKGDFKSGNIVLINERAIRALNEIDDNGVLEDMLLRSRESLQVKHLFDK